MEKIVAWLLDGTGHQVGMRFVYVGIAILVILSLLTSNSALVQDGECKNLL